METSTKDITLLLELLRQLNKDNIYISKYIDKNMSLIDNDNIEELNKRNTDFYPFLNEYTQRNLQFKESMNSLNLKKVDEISQLKELTEEESTLINELKSNVKIAEEKMNEFRKQLSGELNLINKVKHFKKKGKLDFKL